MKFVKVKEIIKEVKIFIEENYNEYEFIVDINCVEVYEIDFINNCFIILECCNVFVREEEDKDLEKEYEDDVIKKIIKNGFILYITF
jgi:hypothetical protein